MPADGRATTLLVADDDRDFREVLVEILGAHGFRVLEASDGDEALEVLGREEVDLLVTDQRLPGLTGTELIEALRARGTLVPTILVTAAADVEQLARAHGVPHFLGKPFGGDEIVAAVERALAARS
jgi:two-component system response regulator AtoC